MKKQFFEILDVLEANGFSPSQFVVYNELSCEEGFLDLTDEEQKAIFENVYNDYIRQEYLTLQEAIDQNIRRCAECGRIMIEGYCIEQGVEYFCSDSCLYENYTKEEFEEMYNDGEGDTYYTEWR
jgi:hypothetical protein